MPNYLLMPICEEYLLEKGLPKNSLQRVYANGVSCLRMLGMNTSTIFKSVELPIMANDTVILPQDFLNYISISVVGVDGFLHGLGKNERIDITQYFNSCGVPIRKFEMPVSGQTNVALNGTFWGTNNATYLANHWRNGENIGAYFNAGGHNRLGEYRLDYTTNRIVLSALTLGYATIILEYIADITAEDNDYPVHPYIVESVKAWIDWKMGKNTRQNWEAERQSSVALFNTASIQDWITAFRSGNSAVSKF